MTIENVIQELRALSPTEIRQRLDLLESEQKTLRTLLRTRLVADSESHKRPAAEGGQR